MSQSGGNLRKPAGFTKPLHCTVQYMGRDWTTMDIIDVHTHFIPKSYLSALDAIGITSKEIGFPMAPWDVSERLALMDANDIQTEVLSLSSPGIRYWQGTEAATLTRKLNDELADIVRERPTRFGGLATLPLPDIDASLAEIEYAFDTLKADGVVLMTNYDGVYLGNPVFAPVLDELNRRGAVIFVHPTEAPSNDIVTQGYPAPAFEYPADTTRMVVSLIDSDTMRRCPKLKIVASHGGGTIPFIQPRLAVLLPWKRHEDPAEGAARVNEAIAALYYDTAIVSYPASLQAISMTHDVSKIVVGFDLPFFPPDEIGASMRTLAAFDGYSDVDRTKIRSGNALNLFPRLAETISR